MPIDNLNGYQTRDGDSELLRQLLAGPAGTRDYPLDWSIGAMHRQRPTAIQPPQQAAAPNPMGQLDLQIDYTRMK
jgi:hypothetical protein